MISRSGRYYVTGRKPREDLLRFRACQIVHERPRVGYMRITVIRSLQGVWVDKNTVYRIYKEECLDLRKVPRCREYPSVSRVL